MPHSHPPRTTARVGLSWPRRQWLRLVATIQDHPRLILSLLLTAAAALAALFLFYGVQLRGFSHFRESFSRWRVQTFGGAHQVNRAVRVYDLLLSFDASAYDRFDVTSLTSLHVGATAFRRELEDAVRRDQGQVRIIVLDPRLADPSHPLHARFTALAERLGQQPYQFSANLWHAAAAGIQLADALGPKLEVRFLDSPIPGSEFPWFSLGHSAHLYNHSDPSRRLDVLVPRPNDPHQKPSSAFEHPALVIHNRPSHPEVRRFQDAFNTLWKQSQPLDPTLRREFLRLLDHGQTPITNQP